MTDDLEAQAEADIEKITFAENAPWASDDVIEGTIVSLRQYIAKQLDIQSERIDVQVAAVRRLFKLVFAAPATRELRAAKPLIWPFGYTEDERSAGARAGGRTSERAKQPAESRGTRLGLMSLALSPHNKWANLRRSPSFPDTKARIKKSVWRAIAAALTDEEMKQSILAEIGLASVKAGSERQPPAGGESLSAQPLPPSKNKRSRRLSGGIGVVVLLIVVGLLSGDEKSSIIGQASAIAGTGQSVEQSPSAATFPNSAISIKNEEQSILNRVVDMPPDLDYAWNSEKIFWLPADIDVSKLFTLEECSDPSTACEGTLNEFVAQHGFAQRLPQTFRATNISESDVQLSLRAPVAIGTNKDAATPGFYFWFGPTGGASGYGPDFKLPVAKDQTAAFSEFGALGEERTIRPGDRFTWNLTKGEVVTFDIEFIDAGSDFEGQVEMTVTQGSISGQADLPLPWFDKGKDGAVLWHGVPNDKYLLVSQGGCTRDPHPRGQLADELEPCDTDFVRSTLDQLWGPQ